MNCAVIYISVHFVYVTATNAAIYLSAKTKVYIFAHYFIKKISFLIHYK